MAKKKIICNKFRRAFAAGENIADDFLR